MATKLDVKWSHDYQLWVATDQTTPGLCGAHPNKTKARKQLRAAQADERRARALDDGAMAQEYLAIQ